MPPKKGKVNNNNSKTITNNNNQAKLKYTTSCIKTLTESLPRQTFSSILPIYFETLPSSSMNENISKTPSSKKRKTKNKDKDPNNLSHISSPPISSSEPITLSRHFYNIFPIHPNINVACVFCDALISPGELKHYIEQPHARRRYTPMCEKCYGKV